MIDSINKKEKVLDLYKVISYMILSSTLNTVSATEWFCDGHKNHVFI
jgi:hypothetical protein